MISCSLVVDFISLSSREFHFLQEHLNDIPDNTCILSSNDWNPYLCASNTKTSATFLSPSFYPIHGSLHEIFQITHLTFIPFCLLFPLHDKRRPHCKVKIDQQHQISNRIHMIFLPLLLFFTIPSSVLCLLTCSDPSSEHTLPQKGVPNSTQPNPSIYAAFQISCLGSRINAGQNGA